MKQKGIHLKPIKKNQILFVIEGTAPLLCDRQPIIKKGAKPKDLEAEEKFKICWYPMSSANGKSRYGIPATAFKSALVAACRFTTDAMTNIRPTVFVESDEDEYVEIYHPKGKAFDPIMLEGITKTKTGATVNTVYAMFPEWAATVRVSYWPSVSTAEGLARLLQFAGEGVGVGVRRPEKGKEYGKFRIAEVGKIDQFNIL